MCKLIIAVMYVTNDDLDKVKSDLISKYGLIVKESESYDFTLFTSYYNHEMGSKINKKFLVFDKLIQKKDLIQIKNHITLLEKRYSKGSNRTINLDPGYLSTKELVLATFKGKGFKEQISDKIWLHKVLEFKDGSAITFYHTFDDYKKYKNLFISFI